MSERVSEILSATSMKDECGRVEMKENVKFDRVLFPDTKISELSYSDADCEEHSTEMT